MDYTVVSKNELIEHPHYKDIVRFIEAANLSPIYVRYSDDDRVYFLANNVIRYLLDYHKEKTKKDNPHVSGLGLIFDYAYKEGIYTLRDMIGLYISIGYSLCGFAEIFGTHIDIILGIKRNEKTEKEIERTGVAGETKKMFDLPFRDLPFRIV